MKHLLSTMAVLVSLLLSVWADGEKDGGDGEELITKTYRYPREWHTQCLSSFWIQDPKPLLEQAGVSFGPGTRAAVKLGIPGASVHNPGGDHQLVVLNTADQHELVEQFMESLRSLPFERQVAAIAEVIEMDRASYQRWQFENSLDDTGDALRRFVQKKVRSGDAEVKETLAVTGRSAQLARAASFSFEVYPTATKLAPIPEKVKLEGIKAKIPRAAPGPTAWECRDVGRRLEVKPTIRDNHTDVDLSLTLTITGHDKSPHSVWPNEDVPDHERREIPICDTRQVTTQVTVTHGSYALISVWKPTDKEASKERVQLVFVRADIMRTAKSLRTPAANPPGSFL